MNGDGIVCTQEADDLLLSQGSDDSGGSSCWGRLFCMGGSRCKFPDTDLCQSVFSFGRADYCDLCVTSQHLTEKYLNSISSVHFKLHRVETNSGSHTELEDTSLNGTYVNGERVGRGNRIVLTNNAEIALSLKSFKVFVFHDYCVDDHCLFPSALLEKYTVSRLLGTGACGEVRLAFKKGTAERCAVKIVARHRLSLQGQRSVSNIQAAVNEMEVAASLNHPCVIRVLDVVSSDEALCLVMELVEGGELLARVQQHGQLPENQAKLYFYQMLRAVEYLHNHGVVHRDLKPENVLMASDNVHSLVKIGDFGLAKLVGNSMCLRTVCGTPTYVAPEVMSNQKPGSYSLQADCWSLGVILFICLGGYPPFSSDYRDLSLNEQILRGRYSFPAARWRHVSANATDLIRRLLTVEPRDRISVHDALLHPWLQDKKVVQVADRLMSRKRLLPSDGCGTSAAKKSRRED